MKASHRAKVMVDRALKRDERILKMRQQELLVLKCPEAATYLQTAQESILSAREELAK